MTKEKTDLFEHISLNSKKEDYNFVSLQDVNRTHSEFMPYTTAGDIDSLQDSRDKANLLEQEAYEKGFAQGEKDGFELGEKKAVKIVEKIENILVEMTRLREAILRHHEKDILKGKNKGLLQLLQITVGGQSRQSRQNSRRQGNRKNPHRELNYPVGIINSRYPSGPHDNRQRSAKSINEHR